MVQHKCAELFLQYLLISGNFFFRKSQVELREQIDKLAQGQSYAKSTTRLIVN